MNNSFWNNPIVHAVVHTALILIPVALMGGGTWQSWTLGGILTAGYKILQNKSQGLTVTGVRK